MREEAELLARQEAYARAAAEPIVIDNTPRPMPPELNQTLETVAEQGEEEMTAGRDIITSTYIPFIVVI